MKYALILLFDLVFYKANSQNNNLKLSIGISQRGGMETIKNKYFLPSSQRSWLFDRNMNEYEHYNSTNFNVNISVPISSKNLFIQSSNYLRYAFMQYKNVYDDRLSLNDSEIKKTFRTDHFIDLIKKFNLNKKKSAQLKIGYGYGIMNTNSNYTWLDETNKKDVNGDIIYEKKEESLSFWCTRFFIGYEYKNIGFTVIAHESKDFNNPNNYTWWPEFGLAYTFGVKK